MPEFLLNPCDDGPIRAIFGFFVVIPVLIAYTISFPVFVLFPLGIILILRIIETEPVPQESSQSRGLLAAQIVASLQSIRYQLSSDVGDFVRGWLEKIFRG